MVDQALLNDIEERLPKSLWPLWVLRMAVQGPQNRSDRYYMWRFYWYNGVPPKVCTYWVSRWASLRHLPLDKQAYMSLVDLEKASQTPEGRATRLLRGKLYDVHTGVTSKFP